MDHLIPLGLWNPQNLSDFFKYFRGNGVHNVNPKRHRLLLCSRRRLGLCLPIEAAEPSTGNHSNLC
jgi:hypothetical protein